MTSTPTLLRRTTRWLAPALAALLGVVLVLGSLHRHSDLRDHDACVLCTIAHTPATAGASSPALSAPAAASAQLPPTKLHSHSRDLVLRHAARAPPLA